MAEQPTGNSAIPPEELPEQLVGDPETELTDNPDDLRGQDISALSDQDKLKRLDQNVGDIKKVFQKEPTKAPATSTPADLPAPPPTNSGSTAPKPTSPELATKEKERVSQAKERINAGKQKVGKTLEKAGQLKDAAAAGQDIKENAGEYAKAAAKEALTRPAKEAAKAWAKERLNALRLAAKAAWTAVRAFVADNPIVWLIVAIIAVVAIIILVIFGIYAFSRSNGKGPANLPTTVAQQQQATLLAALSGDRIANNLTVKTAIDSEKARYGRIKDNAAKYSPDKTSAVETKIAELTPLLDALLAAEAKAERLKLLADIEKKMSAFEVTLPFGSWISQIAQSQVGQASDTYCKITGASGNLACASFVSTILFDAGVPNAIVGSTSELWNSAGLRIVVDRPSVKSADIWKNDSGKLKPGDVVWWGDGSCSTVKYNGKIFDHVGIYIGDGNAIANSSSAKKIQKRATSGSGCQVFNGAKRYGSD